MRSKRDLARYIAPSFNSLPGMLSGPLPVVDQTVIDVNTSQLFMYSFCTDENFLLGVRVSAPDNIQKWF